MRCLGAVGGQCPHYLATCGGLSGVQHGALVHTPHAGSYNPPPPRTCPLHCPALPGVMCYAHNNNVMCDNRDIDVEFCKKIWRSGEGPCQGLSRVNLQSLCNIVKTSSMSSMSKLPNTKNVMCDIIVSRVAARRNKSRVTWN